MELGKHIEKIGRVGSLPEIANEINGRKLVRFMLTTSATCISNGYYTHHTLWYTVNLIGKTADMIINNHLRIGDEISIAGYWLTDRYTDQFGNRRYNYEIYAESVEAVRIHKEKVA